MEEHTKLKIYRAFGAEYFQKVVFRAENVKYKIMDKVFPNIDNWYEKQCNKKRDKEISKVHSPYTQQLIIDYYRNEQLKFRRELTYKENRNYHYNLNYPTKFTEYLESNKSIHVRALKINISIIAISLVIKALFEEIQVPAINAVIGYEIISALINFQCINLQNYNLCRFKMQKPLLEKIEIRNQKINLNKYKEATKVVSKALQSTSEIPKTEEIINQITTEEEKLQLLSYARAQVAKIPPNTNDNSPQRKLRKKI